MSEGPSREEVYDVVDRAVGELLNAAGVAAPPVDAITLAQGHLGLLVGVDGGQANRGGGRRAISLRPGADEEQHQWTVSQAIGEHLEADLLRRLGIDPTQRRALTGESLANRFAGRLLVPTAWLADAGRAADWDLLALKETFRTASHEAIAWRLLDLPEPCVITVVDNDAVARRRSNAWRVDKELSAAERRCQQYVHRYVRPHQLNEDGWRVQGWPIHAVDWKREVLRGVRYEEE